MEFLIEKVIDALLEATGIKERVSRHEAVIRWLDRFGLTDVESLQKFEDVYAYAVVEFAFDQEGRRKDPELVKFFKAKDVQDLFRLAYGQNDSRLWLEKGQAIAESRLKGKVSGMDPKRELGEFAYFFLNVVKQTRSPKEIRQDQRLESLQRQLGTLQDQLQQLPTLEAINQLMRQLAAGETLALPAGVESRALGLSRLLGEWFEVLNYDRAPDYEKWTETYFEWIINFPLTRRKISRILVRGVDGEVGMDDLMDFREAVVREKYHEEWLVGQRRVAKAVREAVQGDEAYADLHTSH